MTHRIALWAHPRSLSTAFERIFIERADATVLHEPYSGPFFFGPERGHPRFATTPIRADQTFARITDALRAPAATPILFFKDLAMHLTGRIAPELLAPLTNTFIVRRPDAALRSFHAKLPDFDWTEAGYQALLDVFHTVTVACGQPAIVVEADDLQRDPHGIARASCARVGVPFDAAALSWQPRRVAEFASWEGWHDEAQFSRGIEPPRPTSTAPLPLAVAAMIDRAWPCYHALAEHRLHPIAP